MDNTQKLLESMVDILNHIKEVQDDVIQLSKDSVVTISGFLADNKVELSEDVIKALQYQDIVSQQLKATTEAIDAIDSNIRFYIHALKEDSNILTNGFEKLNKKLVVALEEARLKKSAFSGNAIGDNSEYEIEFF